MRCVIKRPLENQIAAMPEFETVHTVTDYWDGPRRGIADYCGMPHLYESTFDEAADTYSDTFHLSPVSESLFQLALEDWEIWLRWEAAFHRGEAGRDSHPALPPDRRRHQEIQLLLKPALVVDESCFFQVTGEFRIRDGSWKRTLLSQLSYGTPF